MPASARGLHLGAGEPAGVLDLVVVDVDLARRPRGRRSRASGWPAAARAGCRSTRRRRPRPRSPRAPRGVRRPRGSPPARRSPRAWSSGPPARSPGGRAGSARPREPGLARGDDHDHRRVGARELARAAVGAGQLVAGGPRLAAAAAARAEAGDEQPLGQAERVEDQRRARPARRRRGAAAARAAATHSSSAASATSGADDHREPGPAVVLAEQHPQPVGRVLPARPTSMRAVDAAGPGCRRRPAPGSPGRPTAPRARRRRARRTAVRSWASAAMRSCG